MFKSKKVKSLLMVMALSLSLSNFAYAATCKVPSSGNCQTANLCNANITQVLNSNSLSNGTSCTANNLGSLAKQCGVSVDALKGMINNCSNGTCSNQMLKTLCANKLASCPSKTATCPKAKKAKSKVKAKTQINAKQCINKTSCNK